MNLGFGTQVLTDLISRQGASTKSTCPIHRPDRCVQQLLFQTGARSQAMNGCTAGPQLYFMQRALQRNSSAEMRATIESRTLETRAYDAGFAAVDGDIEQ